MIFIFKILLLHTITMLRKYGANIQCALKINEVQLHQKSIYKLMIKINCIRFIHYTIKWRRKKKLPFAFRWVPWKIKKKSQIFLRYFVYHAACMRQQKINVTFFVLNKITGSISLSRIYFLYIIKYLTPLIPWYIDT